MIFIALFPGVLHEIPLTALAAILIMVGFKLASPIEFKRTYEKGIDQLIIFLITIIITIAEDLLVGVIVGILVNIILLVYQGLPVKNIFKADFLIQSSGKEHTVVIQKALVFTNYLSIKKGLYSLPLGENVKIVLENVLIVGHTSMTYLEDFIFFYEGKGGKVTIEGLEALSPVSSHPHSSRKFVAK